MKRVFAAMLVMGSASIVTAVIGMINTKVLAVNVGPSGVGVLSQLVNFNVLVIGIATFGLGDGIIKFISELESGGETDRLRDFLASMLLLLAAVSLLVTTLLVLTAHAISIFLFSDEQYAALVWLLALSLPFSVLSLVLRSAVNGYRQVRYLALMSILPALSVLLLSWPLVSTLQLVGAVLNVVISTVLTLGVAIYYFVKSAGMPFAISVLREGRLQREMIGPALGFGVASLVGGLATNQALIWARKFVIVSLGTEDNGLFSVVNSLSYQTLNLVLIVLGSYSYARISALRTHEQIANEINYTLRVMLVLGVAFLFLISVFRRTIVPILFTRAFLGAAALIPLQVVGDFIKITMWVLHLPQLAMGRKLAHVLYLLLWCSLFVGLSFICIKLFGLIGVVYAHIGSHLIVATLLYFDLRATINLRSSPENWKLFASSLVLLLSAVFVSADQPYLYLLLITELLLWAALTITSGERLAILRIVRARLRPL